MQDICNIVVCIYANLNDAEQPAHQHSLVSQISQESAEHVAKNATFSVTLF